MIVRAAIGVGLLALGYYIGREVGRAEHLRDLMQRHRAEHVELDRVDNGADSPEHPQEKDADIDIG